MDDTKRKRIRRLVSDLNKARRRQARQIDMLCKDVVGAHGMFVRQLNSLTFIVNFYESILGLGELGQLLEGAAGLIAADMPDTQVAVFVLHGDGFEIYKVNDDSPIEIDPDSISIENCFNGEVVRSISRTNSICTMDDMCRMGLEGDRDKLSQLSAAVIPLGRYSPGLGFILVYRNAENKLTAEELSKLAAITPGLGRAIQTCQNAGTPQAG